MPSLWKKPKVNRISRLVADLQTPPKRGESLVVETGFPTSLVDLFVKNRDRLKKSSRKKNRLKHSNPIPTTTTTDHDLPLPLSQNPMVSDPPAFLSKLDMPSSSMDEKKQEIVSEMNNPDLFVREINAQINPDTKLKPDCSKEEEAEDGGISNSKNVVCLSVFMAALVVFVALYTKRFVVGITLGALLLLLFEYVGNSAFKFFKPCEGAVLFSVLKGALVVVVPLYTKSFFVGIAIGALLLILLEYIGHSILRFFKPCEDARRKSQGFPPCLNASRQGRVVSEGNGRRVRRVFLKKAFGIGLKREVQNGVLLKREEIEQELGNGLALKKEVEPEIENEVFLKREIEHRVGNGIDSRRGLEQEYENGIASKGEIEHENVGSTFDKGRSCLAEEEVWNKPVCQIEAIEQNSTIWPTNSKFCGPSEYCELRGKKGAVEGGENGGEGSKIDKHNGKTKKGKKFWKKFVPKNIHRKTKHKHESEHHRACLDHKMPTDFMDSRAKLKEEDKQEEDEQEMGDREGSSSSLSSSSDEEELRGVEHFCAANSGHSEILQIDNTNTKSSRMVRERCGNLKWLTIVVIALAGLLRGHIFALVVTVICCLIFKLLRSK